jgi:hypothetical protein
MSILFSTSGQTRVSLGTSIPLFQNVGGGTLMGWAFCNGAGAGGILQTSVGGGGAPSRFTVEVAGGAWLVGACRLDADGITAVVGPAVTVGAWTHIAVPARYTGGGLDLYINGVFFGTTPNAAWIANTSNTPSGVGHIGSEDDGLSNWFDGRIDDCRVYHRALTANEINTIYRARGTDTILRDLVHRWNLNEAQTGAVVSGAGSVKDKSSGSAAPLPGTATNGPLYSGELAIHRRRRRAA